MLALLSRVRWLVLVMPIYGVCSSVLEGCGSTGSGSGRAGLGCGDYGYGYGYRYGYDYGCD